MESFIIVTENDNSDILSHARKNKQKRKIPMVFFFFWINFINVNKDVQPPTNGKVYKTQLL